jgi:hypothetical protein
VNEKPFLSLVTCLQRSSQQTQDDLQLDLFCEESTLVAHDIVRDCINAIQGTGVNLSDLKVQLAVGAWRERAVTRINQFLHQAGMRPRRS